MNIDRASEKPKRLDAPEARMWSALRALEPLGFDFRRQVPLGRYSAHFASESARLIVEIADTSGFNPDRDRDLLLAGYDIVRIAASEVLSNLEGVMTLVMHRLEHKAAAH